MSPPVSAPRAFVPATVLAGTIVEHGKIYFDFTADETFIGTFSARAISTRRA
jgi:hypothetical protein